MIELLVVILIVGILARDRHPRLLGSAFEGTRLGGQVGVRNAASAAEAFATDSGGSYTGLTQAKLQEIEPSLTDTGSVGARPRRHAGFGRVHGGPSSPSPDKFFTLTRSSGNTYRCTNDGTSARASGTAPKW